MNKLRFDKIIAGLSEKKYRKSDNPREEFHQSEIVNKEIPGKQKAFDIPGDKTKSSITKIARNKFFNEKFENNEDIKYKNDTDLIALTSKELQNLHIDDDDDDEDDIGLKNYNMKLDIDDIDDLEDDDEDEY